MKLCLIKLGKVLNVMKRDGVWNGLKRAAAGLWATAQSLFVRSGEVLIVTSGIGDSARYRGHHVAEELRGAGLNVSVTVQDNPMLARYVDKFSVFVFHRALYMGVTKKLYDAAKAAGKEIIFETDDLVYDPKFLKDMDFYKQMQGFEKMQYKNGVGGEMVRDPYVTHATTTTSFLAAKLREEGKEVFVVPNKLNAQDVAVCDALYAAKSRETQQSDDVVTIGYFSGVISHNKDFETLTPVFVELFARYPQLRVVIYGPLDVDSALAPYKDRFVQNVYVPREEHFANIAKVDVNIAPLEYDNPFCEGKSELKFFEAGAVGVPTVAAATQTFREAITHGEDGFVASSADEWVTHLSTLIENPDLRKQIGQAAHKTTHARYTTKTIAGDYVAYLRTKITKVSVH